MDNKAMSLSDSTGDGAEIVNVSHWFTLTEAKPITVVVYPTYTNYMATFFCILFIIVGIFGNLVTIMALVRSPKLLHNATTVFVINLCVAYVLFCTICLPLTAARFIHKQWIFGVTACVLYPFFFYGNFAASLMSMVAITINRYILIVHNHIYDKVYKNWCIILWLAWVWLFSFGMVLPPLAGWWGEYGYNNKTFSCTINDKEGSSPKKFLFIFGFAMPCVIILICYTIIFLYVRKSKRRSSVSNARRERRNNEEMKLTRMMLIIFCTFLLCFLPLTICNVVLDEEQVPTLQVVASICAWCSSVINPFIYAVMNRTYRKAYQALMPKRLRQMWMCSDCCLWRIPVPALAIDGHTISRDSSAMSPFNGRALKEYYNNDSGLGASRTPSPRSKRGSLQQNTATCNGKVPHSTTVTATSTLLPNLNNHAYFNCNNNNSCKLEKSQIKLLDSLELNPSQVRVQINQLDLPESTEETEVRNIQCDIADKHSNGDCINTAGSSDGEEIECLPDFEHVATEDKPPKLPGGEDHPFLTSSIHECDDLLETSNIIRRPSLTDSSTNLMEINLDNLRETDIL